MLYAITILPKYLGYRGSGYRHESGNGFLKTISDKGNYGEYLTFKYLERLAGHKRIMTNLYLPKADGSTTEVDLIMICQTGIYVFESKNYSGWIFGDERYKNWTQTLQSKQKYSFFNPIWQNNGHISAIKYALGMDRGDLYKSYIVFSERCTLKKINVTSENVTVIKRNNLIKTISRDISTAQKILSVEGVNNIYSSLQKYALADDSLKKAHIDGIRAKNYN